LAEIGLIKNKMLDINKTMEVVEECENLLKKRRPPVEMRNQIDVDYLIDNQSVIIFEIRSLYDKPGETIEHPVAKATFVNSGNRWNVFWMRSDMKWHTYKPKASVKRVSEFIKLVDEDPLGCFWG